jgi:hypothetical protein
MYVTEIIRIESCRSIGPIFFSGELASSQFREVSDARKAARDWCEKNSVDMDTIKIVSSIVGCL